MARGQRDDLLAVDNEDRIVADDEFSGALLN